MSGRLADNVALFGRALRAAGLPVGPGAVIDAVVAAGAAGLARREDLYWALHSVFVTRHEQSHVFEGVFRIFWRRRGLLEAEMAPVASAGAPEEKQKPGEARIRDALRPNRTGPEGEFVEREVTARLSASDRDVLKARDFAQMSAEEIARARRMIDALVLPDDARRTRRYLAARGGRSVDLRRSLRNSLRGGGDSIGLAFRRPAERPPPLVALVDISGSMAEYSRLFLHFLHALAERRRRVHVFLFATRLTNVTRELAHRDPDEALARASARVQDWEGGTRIATALHDFNRLWSRRVLGGGATVLLFTDGLERDPGGELAFEADRLHRSCRRLTWLNPLLRFGAFEARAGGIRALLPHVDEFRPIHSLASMEALVKALGAGKPAPVTEPVRWLRAAGAGAAPG